MIKLILKFLINKSYNSLDNEEKKILNKSAIYPILNLIGLILILVLIGIAPPKDSSHSYSNYKPTGLDKYPLILWISCGLIVSLIISIKKFIGVKKYLLSGQYKIDVAFDVIYKNQIEAIQSLIKFEFENQEEDLEIIQDKIKASEPYNFMEADGVGKIRLENLIENLYDEILRENLHLSKIKANTNNGK